MAIGWSGQQSKIHPYDQGSTVGNWETQNEGSGSCFYVSVSTTKKKQCVRPWGSWSSKAFGCCGPTRGSLGEGRFPWGKAGGTLCRLNPKFTISESFHLVDNSFSPRPGSGPHVGWEVRPSRTPTLSSWGAALGYPEPQPPGTLSSNLNANGLWGLWQAGPKVLSLSFLFNMSRAGHTCSKC